MTLGEEEHTSALMERGGVNHHIVPQFAKLRLERFSVENQQAFITRMFERGVSRKSALNVLGTLSSILTKARDWGYNCEYIDVRKLRLPPRGERYEALHFTISYTCNSGTLSDEPRNVPGPAAP